MSPAPIAPLLHRGLPLRPEGVTNRMWRKFIDSFLTGCQFWTSNDGTPMDLVICRRTDFAVILQREFTDPMIDWPATLDTRRERFVERAWAGPDFFDDPYFDGPRRGRIWQLTDGPGPFPVYSFDPNYIRQPAPADARKGTP